MSDPGERWFHSHIYAGEYAEGLTAAENPVTNLDAGILFFLEVGIIHGQSGYNVDRLPLWNSASLRQSADYINVMPIRKGHVAVTLGEGFRPCLSCCFCFLVRPLCGMLVWVCWGGSDARFPAFPKSEAL